MKTRAVAIKRRGFPRGRFALRKVHLANIDRNNLRFTPSCIPRERRVSVVNGEIRRPRNNKIHPPGERSTPPYLSVERGNFVVWVWLVVASCAKKSEKIARPSVAKLSRVLSYAMHTICKPSLPRVLFLTDVDKFFLRLPQ